MYKKPQASEDGELGRSTFGVENSNTWEFLMPQTPPPINGVPTHYKIRFRWEYRNYCFESCIRGISTAGCEAGFSDAGEVDEAGLAFRICSIMFLGSRSLV